MARAAANATFFTLAIKRGNAVDSSLKSLLALIVEYVEDTAAMLAAYYVPPGYTTPRRELDKWEI